MRIDGSTRYLYWGEKVAPRLKETYGKREIKIFAILRDPVERAYSYYWFCVQRNIDLRDFDQAIREEERLLRENEEELYREGLMMYGYTKGSYYSRLLQPYLDHFPRDRFLFLLAEDLKNDFDASIRKIEEFLGVDHADTLKPIERNKTKMTYNMWLLRWINSPSMLKNFMKLFLSPEARIKAKRLAREASRKETPYPSMDLALEGELRLRFQNDICRLEEMIGRDLSKWKTP